MSTGTRRFDADAGIYKFVEIKTKLTSVLVFLYCLAFAFQYGLNLRWGPTLLFFAATLLIDLATTSINNYQGYRKENEVLSIAPRNGRLIIGALLLLAAVAGLALVFWTQNLVLLLTGCFCFFIALVYTTGPLPLTHLPLGELFSGLLYGFFIPFIFVLINPPGAALVELRFSREIMQFSLRWPAFIALILLAAIPCMLVANVMLANNCCDVPKDEAIGRFTLPHYLGSRALTLFALLNYLCFPVIFALILMDVFSSWQLLALLAFPLIHRNTRRFLAEQDKAKTFVLSLQNLTLLMLLLTVSLLLGGLFRGVL